ncbi:hypothetical protein K1719_000340 [Acacia pycnantha]|nr:hypothetical protein K1719_000340 [Acacia pycnantha]
MALVLSGKKGVHAPLSVEEDDLLLRSSKKSKNGEVCFVQEEWPELGRKEKKQWPAGQSFVEKLKGINFHENGEDNARNERDKDDLMLSEKESLNSDREDNEPLCPDGGTRFGVLAVEGEEVVGNKLASDIPAVPFLAVAQEEVRQSQKASGSRGKKAGSKKKMNKCQKLTEALNEKEVGRQVLRNEKRTREVIQKETKSGEVLRLTYVDSKNSEGISEVAQTGDILMEKVVGPEGGVPSIEESFHCNQIDPGEQERLSGLVGRFWDGPAALDLDSEMVLDGLGEDDVVSVVPESPCI